MNHITNFIYRNSKKDIDYERVMRELTALEYL